MKKNDSSNEINLYLFRFQPVNGWLYGYLKKGSNLICDTVEVYSEETLNQGVYKIKGEYDYSLKAKVIIILDASDKIVSRIVSISTYFIIVGFQRIEVRMNDNNITVGLRTEFPLLQDSNFIFLNLYNDLMNWQLSGFKIFINIKYKK